jgi:hypothetical protein
MTFCLRIRPAGIGSRYAEIRFFADTAMDERAFFSESKTTKPARLVCPYCRQEDEHPLNWLVRTKKDRLPGGADERDRAKFAKSASYMVLLDDKAMCKNMRCRKRFDISGIKSMAFL